MYIGMEYEAYFKAMEQIMDACNGRPHWGKMHTKTMFELAEVYPRFSDFQQVRRAMDPTGMFMNAYMQTLFGKR